MNRLEAWHRDEVITIMMADVAQQEAAVGDRVRRAAAFRLMYTGMTALTPEEAHTRDRVEAILFPDGPRNQNERNDALITFHAWKYRCTLITQDGDILERRAELGKLGIRIATPGQAVAWVEERIGERDERERLLAQHYGRPPPD